MNFKKIEINESTYIRLIENNTFEAHCSAQGPLGANVYGLKEVTLSGNKGGVIVLGLRNIK